MPKKKRKQRVDFRKNREKRARQSDLTRQLDSEQIADEDLAPSERMSGRGSLTRRRTVIGEVDDEGETVRLSVDESKCRAGRVIVARGANNCTVQSADGSRYQCTVRRVVRTLARDARNAVVAGDRVLFQPADDHQGVIERVEPRTGVLSRGSQRQQHVLVANVSQVVIVVSADDPPLRPALIDRFLVSAEKGGVRPVVCIAKVDLADPVDLQPLAGVYGRIGYDVVLTSIETGRSLARLKSLLAGQETVFVGQSGVGKSSLLNAIQPGLELRTTEVASDSRKGRHTTRAAVLLELDCGGWVVDTPGIRQLELWDVIREEVEGFFVEFRPFVAFCKFPDCLHVHEDGCGVKTAVQHGLIAGTRYESYHRIVTGDD